MNRPTHWVHATAALAAGFAQSALGTSPRPVSEFEIAEIRVEQNATDGDTEVVMVAKPGDDGLRRFSIRTPDRRRVIAADSTDRSIMGMREFVFESPEPPGEAILAAYPEGRYKFFGVSVTGERFISYAELSHQLPASAVITTPAQDAVIDGNSLTIEWSAVPGVRGYIVEIENESTDPEQSLRVNLPPDATNFPVPAALLTPGSDMQVGIGAVGETGNIVFTEVTFSTSD